MWRPVVPVPPRALGADTTWIAGWKTSIGLTFFVFERGDQTIIGHTGSQKAFRTFFYLEPATRTVAIAAFNTIGATKAGAVPAFDAVRAFMFRRMLPLYRAETRSAQSRQR